MRAFKITFKQGRANASLILIAFNSFEAIDNFNRFVGNFEVLDVERLLQ